MYYRPGSGSSRGDDLFSDKTNPHIAGAADHAANELQTIMSVKVGLFCAFERRYQAKTREYRVQVNLIQCLQNAASLVLLNSQLKNRQRKLDSWEETHIDNCNGPATINNILHCGSKTIYMSIAKQRPLLCPHWHLLRITLLRRGCSIIRYRKQIQGYRSDHGPFHFHRRTRRSAQGKFLYKAIH